MDVFGMTLAAHVRACVADEWLVLLDLRGDRYWALPRRSHEDRLKAMLQQRGLLAPVKRTDAPATPRKVRRKRRPISRLPDLALMIASGLWAASIVRHGALEAAFAWIGARKQSMSTQERALPAASHAELHTRFQRLRCWLPWRYVCLFNALCLLRFLLDRGQSADLVVGVRMGPFAAHCWLEANGAILDTGGEDCASFTEIARV